MTIDKVLEGSNLTISLEGRLDTSSAPEFEEVLNNNIEGINKLIIDMKNLAYISSAGLRVLLSAQKIMNKQGSMVIKNVCNDINEVFEVTGFCDLLTIE